VTAHATPGRLVGVGVGPGEQDLVTVKAVRVLTEADLVLVPVMDAAEVGRAEATVRAHVDHDRIRRVVFALNEREDRARREAAWDGAATAVVDAFAAGAVIVAFATIGDPNVYSTFSYLAQTVRGRVPDLVVDTIPGITAMQALASASGTALCEGMESLTLLPLTAGLDAFEAALASGDTVVAYKGGRHLPAVRALLDRHGRLDGAVFGAALGLSDEDVRPLAEVNGSAAYLSTVIVPATRSTTVGGRL
jgi:precorrin-2/cobalt-factor-2 C20-methyltransferase